METETKRETPGADKRKIVKKGWESLNDTEQRFMKKRLSVEQIEALQQEWVTANAHKDEAEQLTLNLYNNFRKDEFELNGKTKVKKMKILEATDEMVQVAENDVDYWKYAL